MTGEKTYEELVRWAYLGEVWGQAMLERLIELDVFPAEADHLEVLRRLETRTKLRLKSIVGADPQVAESEDESMRSGVEYADAVGRSADWIAWMVDTRRLTGGAVPDYERLLELGPEDAAPALRETLEHELSVLGYAQRRLDGQREDAMHVVVQHLRKWG